MLTLRSVSVFYGRVAAVQNLSLEVNDGELVGLVGHNGAGKTTTLMTITGVLHPSSGDVVFGGRSIVDLSPDAILRLGISLVPEGRRIFGRLTVGENLKIGTITRHDGKRADADVERMLERFPVLKRDWSKSGAKLSGGEQQQLAIARALLSRPKLLLLDEPTLGLAPFMVDRVFEILAELKNEGVTILLVEQNAARTIEVADRTYVMRAGGRLQFHGTAEELARIADFEAAYIGMSSDTPT
jgi:branched-chain amino acid transport system ATP-binding protein